MRHFREKQ